MVKKLLLCVSLIVGLCATGVYAQNVKHEVIRHCGNKAKTAMIPTMAKSHINLNANEVWWGYFNGNYDGNNPIEWTKIGYGSAINHGSFI